MPTILTHAVVAGALSVPLRLLPDYRRILIWGMICSMLPDADTLGFFAGIPYESVWGHRGMTHSIFFSLLFAIAVTLSLHKSAPGHNKTKLFLFFFLCTVSHPLLDAMTNGGLGVALLAPFHNERYFLPYRPIMVSPMGAGFFSTRGLMVLASEFVWIWIPSLVLALILKRLRTINT